MNTPVSFELATLLKEKGFNEPGYLQEVWIGNRYEWRGKGKNKRSIEIPVIGLGSSSVLPTIADVVMWLYKKYEYWIYVNIFQTSTQYYCQAWIQIPNYADILVETGKVPHKPSAFNSPTEAYEAAIEYTLKNLIT